MRDFHTEGIVLKKRRQGDFDYFVDLFTPHNGKITIVAKGALKLTSSFLGKLEIGQQGYFTIHRTQHDYLVLKQVSCKALHAVTPGNLRQMEVLSEILHLVRRCDFSSSITAHVFAVLSIGITYCQIIPEVALIYCKLQLLRLLGSLPSVKICGSCNKNAHENQSFSYTYNGEIFCEACSKNTTNTLTFNQLKLINYLSTVAATPELVKLRVPQKEIDAILRYTETVFASEYNVASLAR